MEHDDEIYPKIEWTEEMVKDDEEFLNDPKVQEAMEATEEALEDAPFDLDPPTVH
jgi:hypothetical protein